MCPYFTLVGRPQTVNENNDFKKTVMDACVTACNEDSSSVVLNTTTDGVASKVQWYLCVIIGFLSGSMNYVSLTDTNHNVKNARYQLIGGSLCAVIGSYILDPWYLMMVDIHQNLWRIDDYASDVAVLLLASVKTIQALHSYTKRNTIKYNFGNHAVMVVLVVFLQLHAYAVNATALRRWGDRALFSFIVFL